ncbi:MAG: hypothetical protein A3H69_05540 [Candidatus Sungbacteria bacterium RIFCSPLOWO2_02_FULL_47_9]|uniref:Uncharacterized protein n=1 Tax=Candidatus Sungbacteria bacterium RIFCSPHIGHO2_01_FULL_47_32 TaxID=1802264 RepID=A0A1G2K760_9BACT|nr:MAG: hypothetical protein UX72_C0024G0005 [Parcubacteria group bacterium GW2011_GWA2_47_10]OGZ95205.1 MAG: hypothetical protein A2633_00270 [Candidatus Sungbacteria bacterium RIFCSPHIGHO2_01_FULL_47_32]OGZ98801.1 MAG: hypothetical protein A3D57_04675 [Candidatus Sungbacteria bacterium RIFCSPHIGHO2_02_FULL_46_12]OHA04669.1 MAG: hypothetical protein A3A28_04575 [Candidatus Sungbacteria bacterium RIFCSPLOWO2_01_FULL_47_32]OHA08918.1 MAG: hypothetical protein A3H69_05540 [Candidatus Sungbacteria
MPYVPSKKTDGKSTDREVLARAVENLATVTAGKITNNLSLIKEYERVFLKVAEKLKLFAKKEKVFGDSASSDLAREIYNVSEPYNYEGAYLGELNYAITRFIQRVPQIKTASGAWASEIRYWLYAATIEALTYAHMHTAELGIGISGVFEDIKDEYKRRVNTAYEAEQIVKSGDCYDAPYYTRLVEVVDRNGRHVGYQEVMLKRSDKTLKEDILSAGKIVLY